MASPTEVSVVIPAMNESAAIGGVVHELRAAATWREILVVDDGSADDTAAQAAAAGARVLSHPYNKGNGAAVKTGLRAAQGDYVLIIDGDGQHQPSDALRLVERLGEFDLVVGARAATMCFLRAGYNVVFEPVQARQRIGVSKIRLTRDGPKFLLIMLRVMTIFSPLRLFLPIAAASFLTGASYAVWTIATQRHVTNSSVLLIMLAVVIFLQGLVSEQIAALRADGRR